MRYLFVILTVLFVSACSDSDRWERTMQRRMHQYGPVAQRQLEPLYAKEKLHYPGKRITLLVFKKDRRLELWANENNQWHHIKNYPILAASGHLGPKLHAGDLQVPEGIYHINAFNPLSHYTLSMQLDYPNAFDKEQAAKDGRTNLGENIFIHGKDSSIGCIAIGDNAIKELFVLSRLVGKHQVDVIIAPHDFQDNQLLVAKQSPSWIARLYNKIKLAMQPFHRV